MVLQHTRQPKLRVGFYGRNHTSEHRGWDDVYFIQQDEAPLPRLKELHHLFCIMRSIMCIGHHGVRRNDDSAVTSELEPK